MDWSGIATAYADRERARLGLPSRADEAALAQKRELAARMGESQIESEGVNRALGRARIEALPAQQDLARRVGEAQIRNYDEKTQTTRHLGHQVLKNGNIGVIDLDNGTVHDTGVLAQPKEFAPRAPKAETYVAAKDAEGNPVFAPRSELGSGNFRPPDPTIERTRVAQAGHVVEQAESLLKDYADPKVAAQVGGMSGVLNEQRTTNPFATLTTGQADPVFQRIRAAEASLSAFQPIMHGARGGENMLEHFEKNIRGNPAVGVEQRAAAVRALIEAAKRIQNHGPDVDLSDLQAQIGNTVPAASVPAGGIDPEVEKRLKALGY